MKTKKLLDVLTASISSIRKEGAFARHLLWTHARMDIFSKIYEESQSLIRKLVRIALVGVFLSFFGEATMIEWVKRNWVTVLVIFSIYTLINQLTSIMLSISRDKNSQAIELELQAMMWKKNDAVGIGTRIGSPFKNKLRTARRCSHYDIKNVGLWPIEALSAVISLTTLLTTLTILNWRICVILTTTASITALVGAFMSKWVREKEKSLQEIEDLASEYYPASLSTDSTFLGISRLLFEKATSIKKKLMTDKLRFQTKAILITTLVGSLTILAIAIQLYFAREELFKETSLMRMGLTVSTVAMIVGTFSNTIRTLFGEQSSIEDVREFQEFLDQPDDESGKNDSSFTVNNGDGIRIMDISFAYPYIQNAPEVIKGVSIEFLPGQAVVIVGANGSGKTTIGRLLSNIHRPQKGCILYGSCSISEYTARSVHEHTLVIPQTGDLYDLPISESLFGVTDLSAIYPARLSKALRMSGANEVLDRLPNGLHTQIGTAYTGGVNLSGGEEQRIRLAGFFYRALDPKIRFIVADEPSRYLDPMTRRRVYDELIKLAHESNKVVITISHDATLEEFDRVIILEKGTIAGDFEGDKIPDAVKSISTRLIEDLNT